MPAIAFLSTDHLEDFFVYDELLIPFFNDNGWSVETKSWHSQSENWDRFDYVIVYVIISSIQRPFWLV